MEMLKVAQQKIIIVNKRKPFVNFIYLRTTFYEKARAIGLPSKLLQPLSINYKTSSFEYFFLQIL